MLKLQELATESTAQLKQKKAELEEDYKQKCVHIDLASIFFLLPTITLVEQQFELEMIRRKEALEAEYQQKTTQFNINSIFKLFLEGITLKEEKIETELLGRKNKLEHDFLEERQRLEASGFLTSCSCIQY